MEAQIWYAIFSTIIGGIYGAFSHLGEVRDSSAIYLKMNKCSLENFSFILFAALFPIVDKNSWYVKGKI